jgi:FAD/FMN-containing dehydrogenase
MNACVQALTQLLGASNVLTEGDLSSYELDWRKRWRGRALAVVRPGSTEEVAAVMRLCAQHKTAVVPQGGNTGLVGGGITDTSGSQILLSLRRLTQVRQVDAANLTLTLEAGCVLAQAQQAAAQAGLLLPLSLASEGSCTIGGNLASNAGGTQVLRYGNARELCLGLEVVTPAGDVWNGLSGLRKDNTGYDLRHLYIGSEGTLGVITAAVLRLAPQPVARMTAMATCQRLADAVRLLELAQHVASSLLTGFEVMNTLSLALVRKHFPQLSQPLPPSPWTVLLELSDGESPSHAEAVFNTLLERAQAQGVIQDAAVASSMAQSNTMWHVRESISLAQSQEGLNIKHDIALPISCIPVFDEQAGALLASHMPGIRVVNFGHLGDGNLHYNVQAPLGVDPVRFLQEQEGPVNQIVYDAVQRLGGSISAEHGIGQLKCSELQQRKSPVELDLMRSIKRALDPASLMNPGKVLAP